MKFSKNITSLTNQETEKIKGGYVFTCEERKRNMMSVSVFSSVGAMIKTYKVTTDSVTSFMETYNNKII